ncbi:unnamed protein product [Vicia faba]|uniref:Uncharacterized protein n=1 Tax=Vicia faba TaxID=3906 RepID=A0AAV1BDX8_VICFA|nr:unnamed protein product [Vicia faba]
MFKRKLISNKIVLKQLLYEWIVNSDFSRSSLLVVLLFCLSNSLEPSTKVTLVCAFKAELVVSFECLHFIKSTFKESGNESSNDLHSSNFNISLGGIVGGDGGGRDCGVGVGVGGGSKGEEEEGGWCGEGVDAGGGV